MVEPQHNTPGLKDHKIDNLGKPVHGHQYHDLSFSDLCLGAEKKIFKKYCIFTITNNTPYCTRIPSLGVMVFTFLVDPSSVIIILNIVCLINA